MDTRGGEGECFEHAQLWLEYTTGTLFALDPPALALRVGTNPANLRLSSSSHSTDRAGCDTFHCYHLPKSYFGLLACQEAASFCRSD